MTKNLSSSNPPLTSQLKLELDLDSFLERHKAATSSSSDEDNCTSATHHRTVDDILNESSSDSENDVVLGNSHLTQAKSLNSTRLKFNLIQRLKSDDFGGVSSRKLPQNQRSSSIFGGGAGSVSRKPGAAFAAATAASRSVRRRALSVSLEGKVSDGDELLGFGKDDVISEDSVNEEREKSVVEDVSEKIDEKGGNDGGGGGGDGEVEIDGEVKGVIISLSEVKSENSSLPDVEKVDGEQIVEREGSFEENGDNKSGIDTKTNSPLNVSETIAENKDVVIDVDVNPSVSEDNGLSLEENIENKKTSEFDELVAETDKLSSSDDNVEDVIEDNLAKFEGEIDSNTMIEENLDPPKKALELAEELEIKQACTGQDWEEGAAAQPMRLEGVRKSSTVLGYFDINADNVMSRAIKSQAFIRDYGTPLAIAVHLNYIALGMSKGVVVVVPSKYSAQYPDNMDPKMLLLGVQADRSQASVVSICFNQQGDLLLAGYGDGHVSLWNLPRGTLAKVITGEHSAPVVHTLFLGQDSQVTRQFKAVTGDSKGLVLLHEFSSVPILGLTVKTQCLLDGQRTGTVLCASPLLPDEFVFSGNTTNSTNSISGVMGGVVGGPTSWKLFNESSSLSEEGVVIFVTHQTALVVRLSPSLEVYAQLSKPEGVREGSMPYTAWKCTTQSRGSSSEKSNPESMERISLLAIAWDRKVQVAKLVKSELKESVKPELKESGKWTLKVCGSWTLESSAVGLVWLDDQMLVILTLSGQLCLFTRDGTLIHQTSYTIDGNGGNDHISYHTYFTNVFGNPEKAFQNSLSVRGASIYILAPRHVVVSRLLLWRERIEVLRNAGDWMGAFSMAMTLYDGQAHGVIDLPRDLNAVKETIMPYMVELLYSYVDEVFSYISVACSNQSDKVEDVDGSLNKSNSLSYEIKEQFVRVGGVAVEFCVHISRSDILFNEIFSKFVAVQQRDTFLELLEPYILKDMLGSLPPEIMQALVEHYNSKGWLHRVEQCVLHMDISSLDFNQVVRLCRESGLYGALIYLFNKGLDDFKTPLEELLSVLRNHERDTTGIAIGYRMLVYLKYCFSGLAFPPGHGKIPSERLPSLRKELLQFLLQDSGGPKSQTGASLTSTGTYLNLHYLLELDTESTLDVLRIAFEDANNIKLDKSLSNLPHPTFHHPKNNDSIDYDQNLLVQKTVDALVIVLDIDISQSVRSSGSDDTCGVEWPSKKDIGQLIEFVASYVACKRANVSKSVLSQILEYLTSENCVVLKDSEEKNESKKKREKQVLYLLDAVPQTDWNQSYVLHLCEKAQFYQVCGLIHSMKHDYVGALDNYIKDVDEPVHAFAFLDAVLLQLSETESTTFRCEVVSRIPELIILSRECTFCLFTYHLCKEREHILLKLQSAPKSLFLYLKTLVEVYLSGTLDFSSLRVDCVLDGPWGRQNSGKVCLDAYLERLSEFPKIIRDNPIEVTNDIIELYLELLCQYEPDSVLKFLDSIENYRVDRCLKLCQEYGIIDASSFLLERVGDVGNALSLTLSGLNHKFVLLEMAVESLISDKGVDKLLQRDYFTATSALKEVQDINKTLHACIGLCQRNSPRLELEESESLWFHLLDSFCKPLLISQGNSDNGTLLESPSYKDNMDVNAITWRVYTNQKCSSILKGLFSQFVKDIVEGMIGYVRLPSIMGKLLADNGSQEFGDFKLTILGMLGTYSFERRILDTAKCLIEDDTFYTMNLLKKGASKGYAPRTFQCCVCNCSFKTSSSSGIQVFNCGHAIHLHCKVQENGTSSQSSLGGCPICAPKRKVHKSKGKMFEPSLISAVSSTSRQTQGGIGNLHPHEFDVFENSVSPQISRFEILNNLEKNQRLMPSDTMPQLRLAPPAVYHEKVNKRSYFSSGPSSNKQLRDLKVKGPSVRFPLKSKIFGKEKTRVN